MPTDHLNFLFCESACLRLLCFSFPGVAVFFLLICNRFFAYSGYAFFDGDTHTHTHYRDLKIPLGLGMCHWVKRYKREIREKPGKGH